MAAEIPRRKDLAGVHGFSGAWRKEEHETRAFASLDLLQVPNHQPVMRRRDEPKVEIPDVIDQARRRLLPRQQLGEQRMR